eukprot:symbB.v1.2.003700.t1/scaffold206.1/size269131/7
MKPSLVALAVALCMFSPAVAELRGKNITGPEGKVSTETKAMYREGAENYIQPEGTPNAQHIHVFDSTEIAALAHYVTKCFSKQELSDWNSCIRSEMNLENDLVSVFIFQGQSFSSWMHCKKTVFFNWGDFHIQICTVPK